MKSKTNRSRTSSRSKSNRKKTRRRSKITKKSTKVSKSVSRSKKSSKISHKRGRKRSPNNTSQSKRRRGRPTSKSVSQPKRKRGRPPSKSVSHPKSQSRKRGRGSGRPPSKGKNNKKARRKSTTIRKSPQNKKQKRRKNLKKKASIKRAKTVGLRIKVDKYDFDKEEEEEEDKCERAVICDRGNISVVLQTLPHRPVPRPAPRVVVEQPPIRAAIEFFKPKNMKTMESAAVGGGNKPTRTMRKIKKKKKKIARGRASHRVAVPRTEQSHKRILANRLRRSATYGGGLTSGRRYAPKLNTSQWMVANQSYANFANDTVIASRENSFAFEPEKPKIDEMNNSANNSLMSNPTEQNSFEASPIKAPPPEEKSVFDIGEEKENDTTSSGFSSFSERTKARHAAEAMKMSRNDNQKNFKKVSLHKSMNYSFHKEAKDAPVQSLKTEKEYLKGCKYSTNANNISVLYNATAFEPKFLDNSINLTNRSLLRK